MSQLTFRYEHSGDPDDSFGWLGVEVATERFWARGGFWVQWQDVEEFGQSLRTYPIPAEAPLSGAWGYEPWEGDALVVNIQIAPANRRGDLKVSVDLADYVDAAERLRTSFLTNYPELEAFSASIDRLMKREVAEAVLPGR
jgi:hypothetical protein